MAKKLPSEGKDDKKEVFCELTLDQVDAINSKLQSAIAFLDVIRSAENSNIEKDSINTLAFEAYDRVEEARDILNQEGERKLVTEG